MAVVVYAGKHQRCNPEPEFKLASAKSICILVLLPHRSPFGDLGPNGDPNEFQVPIFFKVPIFSMLGLRTREKSVQPLSNVDHLINCDNNYQLCQFVSDSEFVVRYSNISMCLLYLTKSARFGQFVKNTCLGPHFCRKRSPLGPHFTQKWVPVGSPF